MRRWWGGLILLVAVQAAAACGGSPAVPAPASSAPAGFETAVTPTPATTAPTATATVRPSREAVAASPKATIPDTMIGTWTGPVYEPVPDIHWTVTITLGPCSEGEECGSVQWIARRDGEEIGALVNITYADQIPLDPYGAGQTGQSTMTHVFSQRLERAWGVTPSSLLQIPLHLTPRPDGTLAFREPKGSRSWDEGVLTRADASPTP